jgi:glycine oxidase
VKVLVLGGGVIGCAIAIELQDRGADVSLIERRTLGAEASRAAAGILGAQIEPQPEPLERELLAARDAYPAFCRMLEARTHIEVGLRASGALKVALDDAERDTLRAEVERQASRGLNAQWLSPEAARAREPELSERIHGAALFADEGQVEPARLMLALACAVRHAGVRVLEGASVDRVAEKGGRCIGAHVAGRLIGADVTVLAAGAWASRIAGTPDDLPAVRPIRGQMVELHAKAPLGAIVLSGHAYAVPRGDGRIACGATLEDVGFASGVTVEGMRLVLDDVTRALPRLAFARLGATWSGLRPYNGTPAPAVGRSTMSGLLYATGHHRNGILLAKRTAEHVAAIALD